MSTETYGGDKWLDKTYIKNFRSDISSINYSAMHAANLGITSQIRSVSGNSQSLKLIYTAKDNDGRILSVDVQEKKNPQFADFLRLTMSFLLSGMLIIVELKPSNGLCIFKHSFL